MAKLTECVLCGVLLRDGRNFDDLSEHVCETVPDTLPEFPAANVDVEAEARGEYEAELEEARRG